MKGPEPFAVQFAGESMWNLRWLIIDTDTDEIPMYARQSCDTGSFCGMLIGDSSSMKLVFDHNGWYRAYFKVFDSLTTTCIGTARCIKSTARKIVEIQAR
jgi:hypothetical protein